MTTVYQYIDGKVIFVTDKDDNIKLVNVVASDIEDANQVADYIISELGAGNALLYRY